MVFLKENLLNEDILYKRIRIPIKSIYKNPDMCFQLSRYVSELIGVRKASANHITGKLLIIFDEEKVCEAEILRYIYNFFLKNKANNASNITKCQSIITKEEAAVAVETREETSTYLKDDEEQWHSVLPDNAEKLLNTDFKKGLSSSLVDVRTQEIGLNILSEKKRCSLFNKFIKHIKEFPANLLLGVGAVSLLIGQIPEAIALAGVVLVESIIGSVQQHKAELSMYSLKDVLVPKVRVLRDDTITNIEAKYLVPGDILLLESGDKIPADARIIECNNLTVTEASLTGESTPVQKSPDLCSKITELGNRKNMLYMGSNVVSGNVKAMVTATGMKTQLGKISAMLENISTEPTPLQEKIKNLTDKLVRISLLGFMGIGTAAILAGVSIPQVITTGISIAVGALPEGLPAVVAVSMALSAKRIANQKAIVRKLTAVETLGSTSVICCDKTGTLTLNEMTVKELYISHIKYSVSGNGYDPSGEISLVKKGSFDHLAIDRLLKAGVLCNNSMLVNNENKWFVNGDPTEGALLTVAAKNAMNVNRIREDYERVKEIPFDFNKRYMTVVVKEESAYTAYCKGAPDCIIDKCKFIYENGEERLLTAEERKQILDIYDNMGERSLRVLAVAYKSMKTLKASLDQNFVLLGLVGMEDPPKKDVKRTIQKCHKAGIKVVMITGDHKNTASSIGRSIGLLTDGLVITGSELDAMSDADLDILIDKIQIFARTSPEQKYRIVKSYKRCGHIVAMTGDGVNDAPAIKESNIGIAMGANGSDIAKDVASITLIDDNFNTIVRAIEEGRTVNINIKNSMKYLLTGNLAELLTVGLASFFVGTLPLIATQILWFNIVSESILGAAIAAEHTSDKVMEQSPVKKDTPLIDRNMLFQIGKKSTGIALSTFTLFSGSMLLGANISKSRTLGYANLITSQISNLYSCRSNKNAAPSRYMNIAAVASFILLLSSLYVPFFNTLLGTAPLGIADWAALVVSNMITPLIF